MPQHASVLLQSFDALSLAYFESIRFEPRGQMEARAASLLPALALARIDGKSPVEYLVGRSTAQDQVRDLARPLIRRPVNAMPAISLAWRKALASAGPLR